MFKLVKLGLCCAGTTPTSAGPCSKLFIINNVRLAGGRLASYWNDFLCSRVSVQNHARSAPQAGQFIWFVLLFFYLKFWKKLWIWPWQECVLFLSENDETAKHWMRRLDCYDDFKDCKKIKHFRISEYIFSLNTMRWTLKSVGEKYSAVRKPYSLICTGVKQVIQWGEVP